MYPEISHSGPAQILYSDERRFPYHLVHLIETIVPGLSTLPSILDRFQRIVSMPVPVRNCELLSYAFSGLFEITYVGFSDLKRTGFLMLLAEPIAVFSHNL